MKIIKIKPLTKVGGSSGCEYGVIENKLRDLYDNQRKIYDLLKCIGEKVCDVEFVEEDIKP